MRSRAYLPLTIAACLAAPCALAAELGEIQVASHMGQPLSAQIELTALAPDELDGLPVRLATPDVYQGGRIAMDPALQSLRIGQLQRDGRRYLQLSTQQPVSAGHVHLYLQLGSGSRAIIRLATVMLTPAPPAPALAPAALPPAAVSAAPARAAPAARPASEPDAAALAARARAEGMVHPPAVFVPPRAAAQEAAQGAVPTMPKKVASTVPITVPALRAPGAAARRQPAPACTPQPAGMPAAECVALDQQNAALNDRLGELEGKIGALQKALATPAAATAAAPAEPAAAAASSGPPHAKPKALAAKEKKAASGGLPWLWLSLGGLLLAAVAALLWWLRQRRRTAGQAAPKPPSKYWVLLRKPFRRKAVPLPAEAAGAQAEAPAAEAEAEPEPFSR